MASGTRLIAKFPTHTLPVHAVPSSSRSSLFSHLLRHDRLRTSPDALCHRVLCQVGQASTVTSAVHASGAPVAVPTHPAVWRHTGSTAVSGAAPWLVTGHVPGPVAGDRLFAWPGRECFLLSPWIFAANNVLCCSALLMYLWGHITACTPCTHWPSPSRML